MLGRGVIARAMANKTGNTNRAVDTAPLESGKEKISTATASSGENQNNNNSRYSLGGARASLGPVKAGRLSNANPAEFGDSGKLSLSGRQSLSAADGGRLSLSR